MPDAPPGPTVDVVALLVRALDADPAAIEAAAVATIIDAVLPPGRALVWRLAERDGWECAYCDHPLGWGHPSVLPPQIEHRTPRSRGGTDHPTNLCLACEPCNAAKGARTEAEWWDHRLALVAAGAALPWTPEAAAT